MVASLKEESHHPHLSSLRILVTGATGLLGSALCARLQDRHEVIGWARGVPEQGSGPVRYESIDLTQFDAVADGIRRLRPEVVVHAAAQSDVDLAEADPRAARLINSEAPRQIARACGWVGAFLIGISTDYVFDGRNDRPWREEDPTGPVNAYGCSKLEGEKAIHEEAPGNAVIRVSGLFGLGRQNFGLNAVRSLRAGKPIQAVDDQVNSPSYIGDVAEGIEKLIELKKAGAVLPCIGDPPRLLFHMTNAGEGITRYGMACYLAGLLAVPNTLVQKTTWAALRRPARRPTSSALDSSRWGAFSGIPLRPWREALRFFLDTLPIEEKILP